MGLSLKTPLKRVVKQAYFKASEHRYHGRHKAEALKILSNIEKVKGKTGPNLLKQCDQYAVESLGHQGYSPWPYVYSAIAGAFKEGWIPDNYYGWIVVPRLKGKYGDVSLLKPVSRLLFHSDLFPDVGYSVNGIIYDRELQAVEEPKLSQVLFTNSVKIVFKSDDSEQGKGVHIFDKLSFDGAQVRSLSNGVFQAYVNQHPIFERFASSVATLRITTVIEDNGDCSARASYLRLSRAADTHVQSQSHIRIPIDLETGEVSEQGYLTNWLTINEHPDSQERFRGNYIPEMEKCVATVRDLHRKFPFARCIGWDVSIDADGEVKILEWNGEHNDIKFSEATQGPCFAGLNWNRLWTVDTKDMAWV